MIEYILGQIFIFHHVKNFFPNWHYSEIIGFIKSKFFFAWEASWEKVLTLDQLQKRR